MKIERSITVFPKEKETMLTEIIISDKAYYKIITHFTPHQNDPKFYEVYDINEEQFIYIKKFIEELRNYPFDKYDFYLEASAKI